MEVMESLKPSPTSNLWLLHWAGWTLVTFQRSPISMFLFPGLCHHAGHQLDSPTSVFSCQPGSSSPLFGSVPGVAGR